MSYRIKEKPKPKPRRTMENLSTPSKIYIQNGTYEYVAIPCWYVEVTPPLKAHPHCRQHHDHIGWPSPRHPDHICQAWDFAHSCCSFDRHKHRCDRCDKFIDMDRMIPIHLAKEGYDTVSVAFKDAPEGLSAEGYIDEKHDWIVRIKVSAECDSAIDEPVEVRYVVFASGTFEGGREVNDVVSRGIVKIIPGPYIH